MMSTYMLLGNITEPVELKKVLAGGNWARSGLRWKKKKLTHI